MEVIKPFVKWAGGKGSLISQLTNFYPFELENGTIKKYVEPFVGGGAVLIDILQKYDVEEAYAFDINKDLINCYNVIKQDVETLIEKLNEKEKEFLNMELENRQEYFYKIRSEYIDTNTFVYFDPPYRPLSITSGFTSYTKEDFNDENQKELADFYKELDLKNAKLMLSNSNPKNTNKEDNFFEDIYKGFNINEVSAKRMINSKAQGRGEISELLITNYKENNECIQENSILKMVVSN